ncbi:hypothetical protein TNCV_3926861 [Trichonephila clavipes]|nr:hypothetical protein TNCV_3926861 [Trichonephila clavipes]
MISCHKSQAPPTEISGFQNFQLPFHIKAVLSRKISQTCQYTAIKDNMRGRIIWMMEAGWSTRRVGRQVDHSDLPVRSIGDQWTDKSSFTRLPGSGRPRQTIRHEDRHII